MPVVATVAGYRLCMYPGDHAPPHLHARRAGDEAMISLEGTVLQGTLGRAERREILTWISTHRDRLAVEWERGQQLLPIRPIP